MGLTRAAGEVGDGDRGGPGEPALSPLPEGEAAGDAWADPDGDLFPSEFGVDLLLGLLLLSLSGPGEDPGWGLEPLRPLNKLWW